MTHTKTNYYILTGAMGTGKSTLLKHIREFEIMTIDEPARQILKEQRELNGDGVPEKNQQLFVDLLLSRSISQFNQAQGHQKPIIFDRGIPDNIEYASFFNISIQNIKIASNKYRYNPLVFFMPGWKEIYKNDSERKMTFEQANEFGNNIKKIYTELGYNVIDIPFDSPSTRAKFVLDSIFDIIPNAKRLDYTNL